MKIIKILSLLGPISLALSSQLYYKCNHKYLFNEITKENDCTNYGIANYKCKHCGVIKEVKIKPNPNKHKWGEQEIISLPTCVTKGIKRCKCIYNEKHVSDIRIDCIPHDLSDHHDHEFPTFRLNGMREHYICHVCDNYLLPDGKTIVSYSDLVIKKYDSTRIDFVESEIKDLSLRYNQLVESDIIYIKYIYIDINNLNEIEKYYLKKERNEILLMNYYDSFLMIVNKYNSLYIN